MTKNRDPTPVYLDPGMHSGLEVKGLSKKYLISDKKGSISSLLLLLGHYKICDTRAKIVILPIHRPT